MKQVKFKLPLRTLTLAGGLLLTASSFAQSNAIKGHVKDASGEPIMGATITVNGKAVGITDMDGNFSVDAAPGANLTCTYLGMTPQTIKATSNMMITLSDDSKVLNEVVVIGYGRAKKDDLTGTSLTQLCLVEDVAHLRAELDEQFTRLCIRRDGDVCLALRRVDG